MGTTSPLAFTGISKFSNDFQTILSRAASIAALPVKALQNDQTSLLSKSSALIDINSAAASFADSLEALGKIGASRSLAATSSDASILQATVTGTAQPGNFTISEVTSLAKASVSTTGSGYATGDAAPVATGAGNYLQLGVGGTFYDVNLAEGKNNLNGVRDAINALGAGVTATVIRTSDPSNPYFLSLSANSTGAKALELRTTKGDGGSNLLAVTVAGTNAQFKINGQNTVSATNVVKDVIPGVQINLSNTTSGSVTVNVASGRDNLVSALQTFADRYNAVNQRLDSHVGETAGVLSGDGIVRNVRDVVRAALFYRTGNAVGSLTDLGISVDNAGQMSFDSSVIGSMSDTRLGQAFTFLGTATTGMGEFAGQVRTFTDPLTGTIKQQQDDYSRSNTRLSAQIAAMQERIRVTQQTLSARLQAADVLLSRLEGQQSMLTASVSSLNLVMYGKKSE